MALIDYNYHYNIKDSSLQLLYHRKISSYFFFNFNFIIGNQKAKSTKNSILPYSYNWPYDFFSLVELAKIEAEVTYKKKMGT